MIQVKFPRTFYDVIQCEEKSERKIWLTLIVYLCNYQTHKIGMNQIVNTYLTELKTFSDSNLYERGSNADHIFDDFIN